MSNLIKWRRKDLLQTILNESKNGMNRVGKPQNLYLSKSEDGRLQRFQNICGPSRLSLQQTNSLVHTFRFSLDSQLRQVWTDSTHSPHAVQQLEQIRELIKELGKTNSKLEKVNILQNHPNLAPLLQFIFHRHTRLHVRPDVLKKRILEQSSLALKETEQPREDYEIEKVDLQTVFRMLQVRQITGNKALDFLVEFLQQNGILIDHQTEGSVIGGGELSLLDVFMRCLDRNLKVGVNERILQNAFPLSVQEERDKEINSDQNSNDNLLNVALGKPISISELDELIDESSSSMAAINDEEEAWYVSRKLDGVRCILQIDLRIKSTQKFALEIVKITPLSRNGRPFHTLKALVDPLSNVLAELPIICEMVENAMKRSQSIWPEKDAKNLVRMYLDGEVCMLLPQTTASTTEAEEEITFVEDFQAIVGPIKRKEFTIENPAYFPFDILSFDEFTNWRENWHLHDPFHVRIENLKKFIQQCSERGLSKVVRTLEQERILDKSILEKWRQLSAKEGWEGLILRKGGKYEGKRTSSIRKLKDWQEDEYVVEALENAKMRLPIGQMYAERMALANVTITHKGVQVKVGSGFSAEQRIKYANNPELILGKSITVAYFEESRSIERNNDTHQLSLRFPRIKMVWEDDEGKRTI